MYKNKSEDTSVDSTNGDELLKLKKKISFFFLLIYVSEQITELCYSSILKSDVECSQ